MKKFTLIVFIVFQFVSCYIFDGISDVSITLNIPDEIIIINNAYVSTLNSIDGKIVRAGMTIYQFHFDIDISAGNRETIKINDFEIKDGDEGIVTDAKFSWDM
jgi:hypothetical protein